MKVEYLVLPLESSLLAISLSPVAGHWLRIHNSLNVSDEIKRLHDQGIIDWAVDAVTDSFEVHSIELDDGKTLMKVLR
jgi:hypothetical protein